jgi:hypothetical protein
MVTIKMYGLEKVQRKIKNLPKYVTDEIDKTEGKFMDSMARSARVRAPHFSGQLASSITYKKNNKGNWQLTVDSPYGWFQEHGFEGKFLPAGMPVQGGYRIGDWMQAKGMTGFGFRPSGIAHPFVQPALEAGLSRLPNMLDVAVQKAIKESK